MENELTELARKLNRDSTVLRNKIDETITLKNELGELVQNLQSETSEVRQTRLDLTETILSAIESSYPQLVMLMRKEVDTSLKQIMQGELETVKESLQSSSTTMQNYARDLNHSQSRYLKRLSRTGISICLAFCLGSIATGLGLWWLFPQHQTIEFSMDQRRAMEYGSLLRFALPKLSEKDRQTIVDTMGESWEEYYKDLFSEGKYVNHTAK